jgi:hypothetical protein
MIINEALRGIPFGLNRAGWIVRSVRWAVLSIALALSIAIALADGFMYVPGIACAVGAFLQTEYRLASIRRKLPVEQWPRRLWV